MEGGRVGLWCCLWEEDEGGREEGGWMSMLGKPQVVAP